MVRVLAHATTTPLRTLLDLVHRHSRLTPIVVAALNFSIHYGSTCRATTISFYANQLILMGIQIIVTTCDVLLSCQLVKCAVPS